MKRALGYFAMGLAGALIALVAHDRFLPSAPATGSPSAAGTALSVRYVNLPGAAPTVAVDFTEAAAHSVDAVVHVTTETTVRSDSGFAGSR